MALKRSGPLLLSLIMAFGCFCMPVRAGAFETNYLASIIPEPEQRGRVVVYDLLAQCMDKPGVGATRTTGGFAIENPFDRAFVITDIVIEVSGTADAPAFFTLNRFAAYCMLNAEGPDAALAIAAYRKGDSDNRQRLRRMIAGLEFLPARSVKYYDGLELMWTDKPPEGVILNLCLTLRSVGVEGVVFIDTDGDGHHGPDEPGIPGARVLLCDDMGLRLGLCYTDYRGYYQFPSPQPGAYHVQVILPPGYSAGRGAGQLSGYASETFDVQPTQCLRRDIPAAYAGMQDVGSRMAGLRRPCERPPLQKSTYPTNVIPNPHG